MASECCDISYNDLDLIFTVDLPTQKHYERVSAARGGEAIILTATHNLSGETGSVGLVTGPFT